MDRRGVYGAVHLAFGVGRAHCRSQFQTLCNGGVEVGGIWGSDSGCARIWIWPRMACNGCADFVCHHQCVLWSSEIRDDCGAGGASRDCAREWRDQYGHECRGDIRRTSGRHLGGSLGGELCCSCQHGGSRWQCIDCSSDDGRMVPRNCTCGARTGWLPDVLNAATVAAADALLAA